MGQTFAPWNLLQVAFISVFPVYLSYIRIVNGMALIALYVFLFALCIPAMFIQMKLGGYNQKGLVGLLSHHLPIAKGVGVALLIDLFLTCLYLAPLVCHFGMYAVISMIEQPYVWGSCGNEWNSQDCVDIHQTASVDGTPQTNYLVKDSVSNNLKINPELEFYHHGYLQLSPAINNISGFPVWTFSSQLQNVGISLMPVTLAIVWILVFLFTAFGARVSGWILFVLGPAFLGMLFAVLGYGYNTLESKHSNSFLLDFYSINFKGFVNVNTKDLMKAWSDGFMLLMNSLPVWTAIPVTIGKFAGKGKISRNLGWLLVIVVYALVIQIPQLAMAPYLGNLLAKTQFKDVLQMDSLNASACPQLSIKLVFGSMPAAFTALDVPPVYAMLFYLSFFIVGFMFLCVSMLTIIDNICDSLTSRFVRLHNRKHCCVFVSTFFMMVLFLCVGLLFTTRAGMYYIHLLDQSVMRLRFITVFILAVSVIIVYVKHTFAICERILISIWCILAATAAAGFWLYSFILFVGEPLSYNQHKYPQTFDLISWIISALPYLAIPAAAMHSCALFEGSCSERAHYMFCGSQEEAHDYDGYYPTPEPSAPPAYTYNSGSYERNSSSLYPMDDLHKHSYDPDMEPLDTRLRASRI